MTKPSGLFVTNNGLTDHIGVAQVLPYLEGLAVAGHRIGIVSMERADQWAANGAHLQARMDRLGITLYPIVRKTGALDKAQRLLTLPILRRHLTRAARDFRPDIVHCRSYMPLWPALGAARAVGAKVLFDTRGFWVDQRIEGGRWSRDSAFGRAMIAIFRRIEARGIAEAGGIVTLTHDAGDVVAARPDYAGAPRQVIPCSVDQKRFRFDPELRRATRAELGFAPDTLVIAYLGSASGVYRMDLVTRLVDAARAHVPKVHLLAIGGHTPEGLTETAAKAGVTLTPDDMTCTKVPHDRVPALLNAADIGVSFIIATPSSLGVSATKVGEYLACGLPVISNAGIGDIERVITDGENGFVLRDEDTDLMLCAAMLPDLAAKGRAEIKAASGEYYSMVRAITSYQDIYEKVAG